MELTSKVKMAGFDEFLERIRTGRYPKYGALYWDGETEEMSTAVHFELNRSEPAETVCERAWQFLGQLTPAEQSALEIEVAIRDGKPVRAILKPRRNGPVRINTNRLRELHRGPG
jgi:hypothetical protein